MDLINATNMQAGYTMGMKPDGRELLVVAVKGTFSIPAHGKQAELLPEQVPLVDADVFTGDPGYSAVLYEVDYAPIKHRCDVLLNGSAYAPGGQPAKRVPVGLRVGNLVKKFNVVGNRCWVVSGVSYSVSSPHAYVKLPISYDNAYGGMDDQHPDKNKHTAYMPNPVGKGFHTNISKELLHGAPLPNTEEQGKPISLPAGNYRPMAFGPMGRQFDPRYKYGGTYDQYWLDNVFPFLPKDFNEAYYQAAPVDQQTDFLQGGELVELFNLTEDGHRSFRLPVVEVPLTFFKRNYERIHLQARADTLVIEPDLNRFTITWRNHIPLKKNIFEIVQILAGKKSKGWWRARDLGKIHCPDLDYAVRAKRLARQLEEEVETEA